MQDWLIPLLAGLGLQTERRIGGGGRRYLQDSPEAMDPETLIALGGPQDRNNLAAQVAAMDSVNPMMAGLPGGEKERELGAEFQMPGLPPPGVTSAPNRRLGKYGPGQSHQAGLLELLLRRLGQ